MTPAFKLVLICVMMIALISLGAAIALAATFNPPTDTMKGLIESCSTVFKLATGAVVGLLGGETL